MWPRGVGLHHVHSTRFAIRSRTNTGLSARTRRLPTTILQPILALCPTLPCSTTMQVSQVSRFSRMEGLAISPDGTHYAQLSTPAKSSTCCTLCIRSTRTNQTIRSWDVNLPFTSTEWSQDGQYILAIAPAQERGTACVFALDRNVEAEDGSDEHQGWVARLDTGLEGLVTGQWVPGLGSN